MNGDRRAFVAGGESGVSARDLIAWSRSEGRRRWRWFIFVVFGMRVGRVM